MNANYTHKNLLQPEDAAPKLGLDEWQESRFVTGDLDAALDEDVLDLAPLDALRIAPAVLRSWEAGPDGLELLAFGSRHEGDAEFVRDWWTD